MIMPALRHQRSEAQNVKSILNDTFPCERNAEVGVGQQDTETLVGRECIFELLYCQSTSRCFVMDLGLEESSLDGQIVNTSKLDHIPCHIRMTLFQCGVIRYGTIHALENLVVLTKVQD